ncbi:MAG: aspartate-semialdehyde dehydrogenase [bacterium]|nr:aspartate-semialdehyde dehydrogenase [bacterium]
MKEKYNFAVVGATGLVGGTMLTVLAERSGLPIDKVFAVASSRSAGSQVEFRGSFLPVADIAEFDFSQVDIALFAGGDVASADYVKKAAAAGALVIDNSSTFRMHEDVPLVVPEVNGETIKENHGIIANPNCSTIQMMSAVAPLHRAWGLVSLSVASYQSVSGAGKEAVKELRQQATEFLQACEAVSGHCAQSAAGELAKKESVFPRPIAFNLFPQIGSFDIDGNSTEETKMVNETKKILGLPNLPVVATCVRVPVFFAHSEVVHVGFSKPTSVEEAKAILSQAPCVRLLDDPSEGIYPTPLDGEHQDDVLVGRIRRDPTSENGLVMWVVADNLRKGAATNAVNIAQAWIELQAESGRQS